MFSNASLQIGLTIGENIHVLSASDQLPEEFSSIVHKIAEEFLASKQNKKRICSFYVILDDPKVNVWFALSGHEEKQEATKHKNWFLGKKLEEMKLDGNNLHVEFIPYREQRSVLPGFSVQGEENEQALILRFMRDGAGAAASNNPVFIDKFKLAPNNSVFLALKDINELMNNQKLKEFYGHTRHLSEFYDLTNFIYDVFYAEKWKTHSEKAESDAKQDGAKFYCARGNNFVFWKMKKSGFESQDFRTLDKDITVYEQCRIMLTTELGQPQFLKYMKAVDTVVNHSKSIDATELVRLLSHCGEDNLIAYLKENPEIFSEPGQHFIFSMSNLKAKEAKAKTEEKVRVKAPCDVCCTHFIEDLQRLTSFSLSSKWASIPPIPSTDPRVRSLVNPVRRESYERLEPFMERQALIQYRIGSLSQWLESARKRLAELPESLENNIQIAINDIEKSLVPIKQEADLCLGEVEQRVDEYLALCR